MDYQKVLILNRKPLHERCLYDWLEESSKSVVLVTTNDSLIGSPSIVKNKFLATEIVEDYYSWSVEMLAESLCHLHNIDFIVSSSEDDVIRAARIRKHVGLIGQSMTCAVAYRDKLIMKKICSAAGISVPKYTKVDSPIDLLSFAETQGFPIVVKPRLGAGSIGVQILTNMNDFNHFVASGALSVVPDSSGIWMAEEYIQAEFYHVDGLMEKGKIIHCWPSHYSSGNFESVRNSMPLCTILVDADDPTHTQLCMLAQKVILAFPPTPFPTSFHLEVWMTNNGPIFCEVASRTGGGTIARNYFEAFGINLSKESIRGQAGHSLEQTVQPIRPKRYVGSIMLPPAHGRFTPPLNSCPVPETIVTYELEAATRCNGARHAGESAATIIVSAASAQEVSIRVQEALEWWGGESRWLV